jgi:predicted transcriptional regulator
MDDKEIDNKSTVLLHAAMFLMKNIDSAPEELRDVVEGLSKANDTHNSLVAKRDELQKQRTKIDNDISQIMFQFGSLSGVVEQLTKAILSGLTEEQQQDFSQRYIESMNSELDQKA